MPQRVLNWIREAIRNETYDMTAHAVEEMVEDHLDFIDVEAAVLNGKLVKVERGDPCGTRYTIYGIGSDGATPVGSVGRFTGTGRYLIVTVYEVTEPEI